MSVLSCLADLSARDIVVTLDRNSIELDAPADSLTNDDLVVVREFKSDIIRLLRLADGLPLDDNAARLLLMDEVDLADVSVCESCKRFSDVQTLGDSWHCSHCDPNAGERRRRTERLLRSAAAIRYTHSRNG